MPCLEAVIPQKKTSYNAGAIAGTRKVVTAAIRQVPVNSAER